MSWINKIYTKEWEKKLRRYARRSFSAFPDCDDYFEEARQEIFFKLQIYKEAEVSDALIIKVFKDAMITRHRKKYGFPRPRAWLLQYGALGKTIFKQLCLKNKTQQQCISSLERESEKEGLAKDRIESQTRLAESIMKEMVTQSECDKSRRISVSIDDSSESGSISEGAIAGERIDNTLTSTDPAEALEASQLQVITNLLLMRSPTTGSSLTEAILSVKERATDQTILSNAELLILRLYYSDQLSEKKASGLVGLSPAQFRVRRQNILEKLNKRLLGETSDE